MSERKYVGALNTIFRNKMVVIATVAAVAMILGAMSVGAAVFDYRKISGVVGGLPASANPFARQVPTERHTAEGIVPEQQVAGAETEVATPEVTPTSSTTVSNQDTSRPVAAISPTPSTPVQPVIPPAPIQVPVAPAVQPVVNGVQNLVSPLTPDPIKQLLHGVTSALPTRIDTGIVNVTLPKLGL